jgi:hypothetical protein
VSVIVCFSLPLMVPMDICVDELAVLLSS